MNLAKSYYYLSEAQFEHLQSISHNEHLQRFIDSELEKAASILRPLGLRAYSEESRKLFLTLSLEAKKSALTKLMDYTSFVATMQENCVTLKDDKACLDVIQRKYGLRISREFMDSLEAGDAIEIIDKDGVQVYRNLDLLLLTDYDVLFLCSFDWQDLYARDSKITEDLLTVASIMLKKNTPLISFGTVEHLMVEKRSNRRLLFRQKHRYGATILNQSDEIVGFILSIKAETVGEVKNSTLELLRSH